MGGYKDPAQAEADSPYASPAASPTAAQADFRNAIGNRNREEKGLGPVGNAEQGYREVVQQQQEQDVISQRQQAQNNERQQQAVQAALMMDRLRQMGFTGVPTGQSVYENQMGIAPVQERTYIENLQNRPRYTDPSQLGDTRTQEYLRMTDTLSQMGMPVPNRDALTGKILEGQRKVAETTPGTKDDQFYLNELSKWNANAIERSSEYHHETLATGQQQKANPYENRGDVALAFEKGGNLKDFQQDRYGFNQNVQEEINRLPGGMGLQETAWGVAKSGQPANVDFQPAIDYQIAQEGRYGPYGSLYGGVVDKPIEYKESSISREPIGNARLAWGGNVQNQQSTPTGDKWNPFVASAAEPTGYISEGMQFGKTETPLPNFEDIYKQKVSGLETDLAVYNALKTDYETGLAKYKESGSSDPLMYQHLTEEQSKLDTMYGEINKQSTEVSNLSAIRGTIGFNNDILSQQLGQQKPEEPRALSFGGLVSDFTRSFEKLKGGDILGGIGLYSQGISRYSTRAAMPDATGFGAYVDEKQATAPSPVGSIVAGGAYVAETIYSDIRKDPVQDVVLFALPGAFKYGENAVARVIAAGAKSEAPIIGTVSRAASRVGPTDFGQYIVKGALVVPWVYESGKSIYEAPDTPEGKGTAIGHVGYQVTMMGAGQKAIADQMIMTAPVNDYKGYSLITGKRAEGPLTAVKKETLMFAGTTELKIRGLSQEAKLLKLTWESQKLSRFIEPPVKNEGNPLKDIVEVPVEQIDPLTKVFTENPTSGFGSGFTYGQFTEAGKYPENRMWDLELMQTESYRNAPDMKTRFAMQDAARPDIKVPEGYKTTDLSGLSPDQKIFKDVLEIQSVLRQGRAQPESAYVWTTRKGDMLASVTSDSSESISGEAMFDLRIAAREKIPDTEPIIVLHTHTKFPSREIPDQLLTGMSKTLSGEIKPKELFVGTKELIEAKLYDRAMVSHPSETDILGMRRAAGGWGTTYEGVISPDKLITYSTLTTKGNPISSGVFGEVSTEPGLQPKGIYRALSKYTDAVNPDSYNADIVKNPKAFMESTYENRFISDATELGFDARIYTRAELQKLVSTPEPKPIASTPAPQYQVAKGMDIDIYGNQQQIGTDIMKIEGSMVQVRVPAEGEIPATSRFIQGKRAIAEKVDVVEDVQNYYVGGAKVSIDLTAPPDGYPKLPGETTPRVAGKYTPEDWKTPVVWRIFGSPFDTIPVAADLNMKGQADYEGKWTYEKANFQTSRTGDALSKDIMSLTERVEGDKQFRGYRFEKDLYHDISTKQQLFATERARLAAGEKTRLTSKQLDKADKIMGRTMQIEMRYQTAKGDTAAIGKVSDILEIGKERMDVGMSLKGEALPPIRTSIGEPKFLKDYPVPEKSDPLEWRNVQNAKTPPKPKGGGLTPEEALKKYNIKTKSNEEIAAKYLGRQPVVDATTTNVKQPQMAQPQQISQPSTVKNIPGDIAIFSTSQPLSEADIVGMLAQTTRYGAGTWEQQSGMAGTFGKATKSPSWSILQNIGKKYGYEVSNPFETKVGSSNLWEAIVQKKTPTTTQTINSNTPKPKQSFVQDMRDVLPESQEPFFTTEIKISSPSPASKPMVRGITPVSIKGIEKSASVIGIPQNNVPSMKGGYGKTNYPEGLPTKPYTTKTPDYGITPAYTPNKVNYSPPPTYIEKPVYTPEKPTYIEKPVYTPHPPYTEKPPYNKPPYVEPPYNPYQTGYPEKPGYPGVPAMPPLTFGGGGGYGTKRRGRRFRELFPLGLDIQVYNWSGRRKPHGKAKKAKR